ncbi:type II toxin-antitoxin system YhaV family toxin [Methylobacterium sp. WL122]|nr:type II toxin-antitoxin system YhaV family toxin [Methylobacterium sp. WL122]
MPPGDGIRSRDTKTDVYAMFERTLDNGHPPDDQATPLAEG